MTPPLKVLSIRQNAAGGRPTFHNAVKWAYTMNWGSKGLAGIFTFVLAAILGPRDFGAVAIAMIYISFVQMFLDQGLVAALVQRKTLRPEHLDSVFWMNLILCLLLVGVSVGLSKWWAEVNKLPEVAMLVCVLAMTVPIEGLSVVQTAILHRAMDFRKLAVRSNMSVVLGGVVGLAMAFNGCGVWALAGQRLSQDLAALGLLWGLSHWRPGRRFSVVSLKEIVSFSGASFLGKLGTFASGQSDALVIAVFFGPVAVGLYRLAERVMGLVLDLATSSLQVVALPEFSRLQDDDAELRRSVLSCIRLSSMVTLPAMAGLAATSNVLMAAIGPQWAPASDALKILSVLGMALVFAYFTGPLLTARSRPYFASLVTWALSGVSIGAVVVCGILLRGASVWEQVAGIAGARAATGVLVVTPVLLVILIRSCRISMRELARSVAPSVLSAVAVAVSISSFSTSGVLRAAGARLELLGELALGAAVAGGTLLSLDRSLWSMLRVRASRRVSG